MDFGNKHVYSVLMGKKILYPNAVDQCGYWPYEKKEKYETFIIGTDEFGNTKEYTCNQVNWQTTLALTQMHHITLHQCSSKRKCFKNIF